jgi:hypothetical protein
MLQALRYQAPSSSGRSPTQVLNQIMAKNHIEPAQPLARTSRGRVQHDERGKAFWDWDVATGVLAGTKAGDLLRMLDDPTLNIAGEGDAVAGWEGDPYNRG